MTKIKYMDRKFNNESQQLIQVANTIINEYQASGYDLTTRQLFYQFVSRNIIENNMKSYKRLGGLINDGRMAGLIDWSAIVDRTRNVKFQSHWDSPEHILRISAEQFALDKWEGQEYRVEVWIEKEALAGVLEAVCPGLDVPYFSCRGYVSQSEQWRAAQRLIGYYQAGQKPYIVHLGDHDPSGIDMTRDIENRLQIFGCPVEVNRIALNRNQIDEYKPPPNPAKMTDPRFGEYLIEHGDKSWELDALEPQLLSQLITEAVLSVRDQDQWNDKEKEQKSFRSELEWISQNYLKVVDLANEDSFDGEA